MKRLVIFLLIAIGVIVALSATRPRRQRERPGSDTPPVTYNLGINFDDFAFIETDLDHYNDKVFLENGTTLTGPGGKEMLPHPLYILPPGTKILSVTNGEIADIHYQPDHDDYSLVVYPSDSSWIIDYDHVTNIKVSKGDQVTAGQVIAESPKATGSLGQYNLGFMEIMIFKDSGPSGNNPTACLFNLLDDSVRSELHARIYKFVSDWEDHKQNTSIYDEDSWESPGCIVNQINEADTHL